ncbi:MAG: hypothetical protein JJT94_10660 [Bernardetiaceae bacterium]|nr:hypothetical protein [Bernardetiaceae bacterium]
MVKFNLVIILLFFTFSVAHADVEGISKPVRHDTQEVILAQEQFLVKEIKVHTYKVLQDGNGYAFNCTVVINNERWTALWNGSEERGGKGILRSPDGLTEIKVDFFHADACEDDIIP